MSLSDIKRVVFMVPTVTAVADDRIVCGRREFDRATGTPDATPPPG